MCVWLETSSNVTSLLLLYHFIAGTLRFAAATLLAYVDDGFGLASLVFAFGFIHFQLPADREREMRRGCCPHKLPYPQVISLNLNFGSPDFKNANNNGVSAHKSIRDDND